MPKGKPLFTKTSKDHFGVDIWTVLARKEFKGITTVTEAAEIIGTISKGKLTPSPITILNTISRALEAKEIKADLPCVAWLKMKLRRPGSSGQRGLPSMSQVIETHFKKPIWEVMEQHCKKCTTLEEACAQLKKVSKDEFSTTPVTLKRNIEKALESNELSDDSFMTSWLACNKKRKRGIESIQSKLENYFGKPIWDILHKHLADINRLDEAPDAIREATKGTITVSVFTIHKMITKGIEDGEIKTDDSLASFVKRRNRAYKKRGVKVDENGVKDTVLRIPCVCQSCGHEQNFQCEKSMFVRVGLSLRGSRCPSCKMWGTFSYKVTVDGTQYADKIKRWIEANPKEMAKRTALQKKNEEPTPV